MTGVFFIEFNTHLPSGSLRDLSFVHILTHPLFGRNGFISLPFGQPFLGTIFIDSSFVDASLTGVFFIEFNTHLPSGSLRDLSFVHILTHPLFGRNGFISLPFGQLFLGIIGTIGFIFINYVILYLPFYLD